MISNFYTLALIAKDVRERISGRNIVTLFSQNRDVLVLSFESVPHLVFSCVPRMNAFYFDQRFARARRNSVDLMPDAAGKEVTSVSMDPADRIVRISLMGGLQLESCFFGMKANVYLLRPDGSVLDSFRKSIDGGSHAPGPIRAVEEFPDRALFLESAASAEETSAMLLKRLMPRWGPLLIEEALARSSVRPEVTWADLDSVGRMKLFEACSALRRELEAPQPRIYGVQQGERFLPERFSLVRLVHLSHLKERTADDIHEAIRFVVSQTHVREHRYTRQRRLASKIERLRRKAGRAKESIEQDLASSTRAEEYEKFGKLLIAHIHTVGKGADVAEIDGHRVPLVPSLNAAGNARRYFDKARRARTARKQSEERLVRTKRELSRLDALLAELSTDTAGFDEFLNRHGGDLDDLGLSAKQEETGRPPFHVFHVEGGFEVLAGRNSTGNDELTLKHSKPNDLWFHVRGAGGSHVLLRVNSAKGEPGKGARHQAAAIAAFFSKMKNAGLVPVSMTLKKHVRKPKGSPSGTVVIEQEETLLVRPGLPQNDRRR